MLRVIIKDSKGRVEPIITKVNRKSRVPSWITDCKYCISYFKGENSNPRWEHKRWERFADIPWDDVEFEVSDILEVGTVIKGTIYVA